MIPAALRHGTYRDQYHFPGRAPGFQRGSFPRYQEGGRSLYLGSDTRRQHFLHRIENDRNIPYRKRPGSNPTTWPSHFESSKKLRTVRAKENPSLQTRGKFGTMPTEQRLISPKQDPTYISNTPNKKSAPDVQIIHHTPHKLVSNFIATGLDDSTTSHNTQVDTDPSHKDNIPKQKTIVASESNRKSPINPSHDEELHSKLKKLHDNDDTMKKEIQLYQNQVLELTSKLNKQKQQTLSVEKNLSNAQEENTKSKHIKSELENLRSKLKSKEDELRSKRTEFDKKQNDIRNKESSITDLTRHKQNLTREVDSLKKDLSKSRRDLSNECQRRNDIVRPLENQNRKLNLEITELRNQLRFHRENADRFRRPQQQPFNQDFQREISDLNQKLNNSELDKQRIVTENQQLQEKLQKITGVLGDSYRNDKGFPNQDKSHENEYRSHSNRESTELVGQNHERKTRFGQPRDGFKYSSSMVKGAQKDSSAAFQESRYGASGPYPSGQFNKMSTAQNFPKNNIAVPTKQQSHPMQNQKSGTGQMLPKPTLCQTGSQQSNFPNIATGEDIQKVNENQQNIENGLYSVERIIGKEIVDGELMYRVKWLGFSEAESSWEPAINLGPAAELIKNYEQSIAGNPQSNRFQNLTFRNGFPNTRNFQQKNDPNAFRQSTTAGGQQGKHAGQPIPGGPPMPGGQNIVGAPFQPRFYSSHGGQLR